MPILTDSEAFFEVGKVLFQALSNSEALISQAEAARIIGCSRQAITGFIRRGSLAAVRVGGRPLLKKTEVCEYSRQTAMRGTKRRREKRFDAMLAPLCSRPPSVAGGRR